MERSTASYREHLTRKATAPPATTSNRNPEAAPRSEGHSIGDRKKTFLQD